MYLSSIASIAGKDASFWLNSNQYGLYASDKSSSLNIFELQNTMYHNQFEINSTVTPVLRFGNGTEAFFHEFYIEANYKNLRLFLGKKEWRDGFAITDLGFGSMIWSSNAATIPKITAEVKDWTQVPFTAGLFSYRGYYSHGWFEKDRFVESSYLHEKALYLYLGKDNWPIRFEGAVIHNVMWGGTHPEFGDLPDNFDDYISIVTFQKGSPDEDNPEPVSFQGSTVGAFDFGILYLLSNSRIQLSKQFYLESRTSTYFRSEADGLWRLEWKSNDRSRTGVLDFSYEVFNTFQQDARRQRGETRGSDQTYSNFIYRQGWTYQNKIIGVPLVQTTVINDLLFITNNIFFAHNLGIRFRPSFLPADTFNYFEGKFTYSRSYGRTTNCPNNFCTSGLERSFRTDRKDQYSMYFSANFPFGKDFLFTTAAALDTGELYKSVGFRIGITYNFKAKKNYEY
ncbi:MAG: capsule assembly Wzi family protein [Balneolaceae bacterium]